MGSRGLCLVLALAATGLAAPSAAALTVMTRNVYLGADLGPVLVAPSVEEMQRSAGVAWAQVARNDFRVRARALAAEIAAARPDVVGLQEAALYRSDRPSDGTSSPARTVARDYLRALVRALRARGLRYRVAARFTGGDAELPLGVPARMDGRITDRMAMLVRRGLRVRRTLVRRYDAAFSFPVGGTTSRLPRGWIEATLAVRGADVVVFSTHLESADAQARTAQARELLARVHGSSAPAVLLGDFNSGPGSDTAAYDVLRAGGLEDAWAEVHVTAAGLTCCFASDLRSTARALSSRIDLVLHTGGIRARRAEVVGDARADRRGGLWPSDHAGVVAELWVVR